MKPKQLANILIKILGLSVCAHGITPAIYGAVSLWQVSGSGMAAGRNVFGALLTGLIPIAIGIILILSSRMLTTILFKDEAE